MSEEKRIYVVVGETVPGPDGTVVNQPCGRISAQVGHVVSKFQVERVKLVIKEILRFGTDSQRINNIEVYLNTPFDPVTTIVKAARDRKEVYHIIDLLNGEEKHFTCFFDDNEEYENGTTLTAFCTGYVAPEEMVGILDYLPLWEHGNKL
jgi:hypothetical protein